MAYLLLFCLDSGNWHTILVIPRKINFDGCWDEHGETLSPLCSVCPPPASLHTLSTHTCTVSAPLGRGCSEGTMPHLLRAGPGWVSSCVGTFMSTGRFLWSLTCPRLPQVSYSCPLVKHIENLSITSLRILDRVNDTVVHNADTFEIIGFTESMVMRYLRNTITVAVLVGLVLILTGGNKS